jgi:tetratricopeptide (TPR) repeat protein
MDRSSRFLTETASMRTLPFSSSPQGDWSFRVGLSLVLIFAAAEIFSVGYYYVAHPRFAQGTPANKVAAATTPVPQPRVTPAPSLAPMAAPTVGLTAVAPTVAPSAAPSLTPAAAIRTPAPLIAQTPAAAAKQTPSIALVQTPAPVLQTPAPSVAPTTAPVVAAASPPAAQSIAERLAKEASTLQKKGDTTTALAKLQDATQRDPKNAEAFAQMATIYETIRLYDRSNETWQKVQAIGPSGGPVYELAMLKLKTGAAAATPAPTAPPAAEASPSAAATARPVSSEGIPDGSTFGIAEVSATETPDSDAETNLMLRIGVKKKPNAVVDHTKVKIQVFFYDTVDDKDIKLTDAEVNYEWLTPNHDWAQANPEVLAVTYVRAKNKSKSQEEALSAAAAAIIPGKKPRPTKSPTEDAGRRKYLGYIVRIYYNDKLQAQRAEPTKLLTLFPSPSTSTP